MKIALSFSLSEIFYTEAIYVQKQQLLKNRVLSVNIRSLDDLNQPIIAKINFTPLPHFHQHTLEEWKFTLDSFFTDLEISFKEIHLDSPYFNMAKTTQNLYKGELLFIIESVLFSLIEKYSPQTLCLPENTTLKMNALYTSQSSLKNTPGCLKIKIRPTLESLSETQQMIENLLQKNPHVRLRLDGNRTFELDDLLYFMEALVKHSGPKLLGAIEYLEEPLKNYYEYSSFLKYFSIPLAFDESMNGYIEHLEFLTKLPPHSHIILKPSLWGLSLSYKLMKIAKLRGHNVIISSTYEDQSAIRPLLFLAAQNPNSYHGLDTLKFHSKQNNMNFKNFSLSY